MSYQSRIEKIEALLGCRPKDKQLKKRIKNMRYGNMILGLMRYSYDEDLVHKYAQLHCEGIEKFGFKRFEIRDWKLVPLESQSQEASF